jgi:hypothetical protein
MKTILILSLIFCFISCSSNSKTSKNKKGLNNKKSNKKRFVPAPEVDPCADLRKEAVAVLKKATNSCKTDKDCGLYSPIDPSFDCGGSTDIVTSKKLDKILNRFFKRKCRWLKHCEPCDCVAKCVRGSCVTRIRKNNSIEDKSIHSK